MLASAISLGNFSSNPDVAGGDERAPRRSSCELSPARASRGSSNEASTWIVCMPLATLMEPPIFRMMEPGGGTQRPKEVLSRLRWGVEGVRREHACGGGVAAWA